MEDESRKHQEAVLQRHADNARTEKQMEDAMHLAALAESRFEAVAGRVCSLEEYRSRMKSNIEKTMRLELEEMRSEIQEKWQDELAAKDAEIAEIEDLQRIK